MITKRILLVVMLAAVALVLSSLLVTVPVSASGLSTSQVFDDDGPDSVLTDTWPTTHPVGIVLATFFNVPYTQVMALHDDGFGFGNIARAYLTAQKLNAQEMTSTWTVTNVLQLRQAGMGWGQFKKAYGVHPGGNGLGSIMRNKGASPVITGTVAPSPKEPGQGVPKGSGGSSSMGGVGGSHGSNCPGNSCNAPGHQNQPRGKPTKAPKP